MKPEPLLFLDIDGVITRGYDRGSNCPIFRQENIQNLNLVLDETGCLVVLSSGWRDIVRDGTMTLKGMEILLRSHGLHIEGRLIGTTGREDMYIDPPRRRAAAVNVWLLGHRHEYLPVIVDDTDIEEDGVPVVRVQARSGLTVGDTVKIIEMLRQ